MPPIAGCTPKVRTVECLASLLGFTANGDVFVEILQLIWMRYMLKAA